MAAVAEVGARAAVVRAAEGAVEVAREAAVTCIVGGLRIAQQHSGQRLPAAQAPSASWRQ